MTPSKLARCVMTDGVALFTVLAIGVYVTYALHIPAAILIIQLLAVEVLCQVFPLSTLSHDEKKHKPRHHKHVKIEIVTFGILAGMIAYASYLLFFAYHILSPEYIDTSSTLYMQATTVTFVTLAFCQAVNILFIRADEHEHVLTDYLFSNKKLLQAFAISAFLILNVVYNPWLHSLFNTASIGIAEWATAVLCAGIYTFLRRLQRYTRKHTRHDVAKLHQKLNKMP